LIINLVVGSEVDANASLEQTIIRLKSDLFVSQQNNGEMKNIIKSLNKEISEFGQSNVCSCVLIYLYFLILF
jgi:hypothetical protein